MTSPLPLRPSARVPLLRAAIVTPLLLGALLLGASSALHAKDGARGHAPRWRPGQVLLNLPAGYVAVPWSGQQLYYGAGIWLRPDSGRYVVVLPPPGPIVADLPANARSYWVGPDLYFEAAGVTYVGDPMGGYRVISAVPVPAPAAAMPPAGGLYPAPPPAP